MAATVDAAAAKQAKQKKILIALSVVLVAVLAIQLPRMMGGNDATPAAAPADGTTPAATSDAAAAPTAAAPTGTATAAAVTGTGPSTSVVGVTVAGAGSAAAGTSRLASFSLFETKDPFVQQVVEETPEAAGAAAAGGDAAKGDAPAGGSSAGGTTGGDTAKPAAPAMTNATVTVNGEIEQLELKDVFPEDEPLFKLLALKPKSAKIGIAGGSLANGQFVTLGLGKKVTLVNSATGARYTIELQYVGTQPEQIEGFATGDEAATAQAPTP